MMLMPHDGNVPTDLHQSRSLNKNVKINPSFISKFVNFVPNFLDLTIYQIYQFCKFPCSVKTAGF